MNRTEKEGLVVEVTDDAARAVELRQRLADVLVADGSIVSSAVEAAIRTVPRHLFAPQAALDKAYAAHDIVVTKRDEHGVTTSSVSAPSIQALMLEQSGIGVGSRALEIGSGGYNAALMAELVGGDGAVTTIDIDPDVVARARSCLAAAGDDQVRVELADGEDGWAPGAPYDQIIVTAGAWDIPPAWVEQLAEGGTLTVPLRMRGVTRSITFQRGDGCLVAQSAHVCGFVTMQGAGAHAERLLLLRGKEIALRFDDGWPAAPELLDGALETPRAQVWSGVRVRRTESFDTLQLWLATTLDGSCHLAVDPQLDTGLVAPQNRMSCPAVVDSGALAYLALRKLDETTFEFGAHAFGTGGTALAAVMVDQIRAWHHDHRRGPGPQIAAYPAGTPDEALPAGLVIPKRHVHLTISWPIADQEAQHHLSHKE
jgi:protein-L-isoaspartate(D-aspartate) O-methyltransferase